MDAPAMPAFPLCGVMAPVVQLGKSMPPPTEPRKAGPIRAKAVKICICAKKYISKAENSMIRLPAKII